MANPCHGRTVTETKPLPDIAHQPLPGFDAFSMHVPCPAALSELIAFFESLPEGERRENLIELASQAEKHAPQPGETFDLDDVRHDPECTDKVGVHLRLENGSKAHFALSFGPKVQTLTRALGVILCRGLNGSSLQTVQAIREDFVPRIIGSELVRLRSQTVYYVLRRMKEAAAKLAGKGESAGVSSDALMMAQPS